MPQLSIAPLPRMTRHLSERGVFRDNPVTVIDVGARANTNTHWHHFGGDCRYIGFEPDSAECERLNQISGDTATFYPQALGRAAGQADLHVHDNPSSSSLYPPDPDVLKRFTFHENMRVVETKHLEVVALDAFLAEQGIGPVDFLHVDAEGADLDILHGAAQTLASSSLLGLCTEIRFNRYMGTPVFSEVDAYLRGFHLDLYDMDFDRECRMALPYPLKADHRHDRDPKRLILGPGVRGQLFWGDALYMRDLVDPEVADAIGPLPTTQLLKLACAFEIFRLKDCAAEAILAFKERIDEICDHRELLEILVPEFEPRRSYDEYLAEYFDERRGFRWR